MNWWYLVFPLTAAGLCMLYVVIFRWLLFYPVQPFRAAGFTVQGWIPRKQPELALQIGGLAEELIPVDEMATSLSQPENLAGLLPLAETHIDEFLRVKLVKAMPVVGMFVGDKTIQHLKTLFMTELETLLPGILQGYLDGARSRIDIKKMVSDRIMAVPPEAIARYLTVRLRPEFRRLYAFGFAGGLLIGFLQLLILFLLR